MNIYIDTLALLFRSYYAIPDLQSKDGLPTGALFGLSNSLFRIIAEMKPEHVIACFDRPEQTIRQEQCAEYKANRDLPEEDLVSQIISARDVLTSYGVHIVEKAGHEADDLLGTLASKDAERGKDVVIVTCDGDLLQLTTNKNIKVYFLRKGMSDFAIYGEEDVEKKNGYPAKHIIDYKGLAGDASDNIKGVSGIGDVSAKKLIAKFGGLDEIYGALDREEIVSSGFTKRIESLLTEGRESAFLSRDLATIHTDVPVEIPYKDANLWKDRIVFSEARNTLEKYSFDSLLNRLEMITGEGEKNVDASDLPKKDVDPRLIKEMSVALWVLDSTKTNAIEEEVYSYTKQKDAKKALSLIESKIKEEEKLFVWESIEKPLISIFEKMEKYGISFDSKKAESLSVVYHKKIKELSDKIYKLAGKEFNINSPKQLREILYTDLSLKTKGASKTSSGAKTTKESVLLEMIDEHPIIKNILEYRHYEKLRSTYIDALPNSVADDKRIHTNFQQSGTSTGRISSKDPNLQNIPAGEGGGTEIRDLFISEKGWKLISIDYSQVELRVAAILSNDKNFIDIFKREGDVHRSVAAKIFHISEDEVGKEQRSSAKAINFGILYGMGARNLSKSINVSHEEAVEFIDEYKKTFSELFEYLDSIKREAAANCFVKTAFGRTVYINGIKSSLAFVRAQAERAAVNAVIQGTAADVIKLAMIKIDKVIQKDSLEDNLRLLLQIHDELLFEVRSGHEDEIIKKLVLAMESVFPENNDPIHLLSDTRIGTSWGSLRPLDK